MAAARAAARREASTRVATDSQSLPLPRGATTPAAFTRTTVRTHPHVLFCVSSQHNIITFNPDPPLPTVGTRLKNFVGEESTLPTPPANTSRSQATDPFDTGANPQFTAQQQELLRALMGGAAIGQPGLQLPSGPANADANADPNAVPPASPEDPLSTLLASLGGSAGGPFGATGPGSAFGAAGSLFGGSASPPPQTQRPRTLVQKLVPVLHVLSMLAMLVWFVGWKEPEEFAETWLSNSVKEDESFGVGGKEFGWKRWARLARGPPVAGLVVSPIVRGVFALIYVRRVVLLNSRCIARVLLGVYNAAARTTLFAFILRTRALGFSVRFLFFLFHAHIYAAESLSPAFPPRARAPLPPSSAPTSHPHVAQVSPDAQHGHRRPRDTRVWDRARHLCVKLGDVSHISRYFVFIEGFLACT
jgi:hypothetical protein